MERMIGYLRVSTDEQARTGYGLPKQRRNIGAEAKRRGWDVQWTEDPGHCLKRAGSPPDVLAAFQAEATAGDYAHLLITCMEYADIS